MLPVECTVLAFFKLALNIFPVLCCSIVLALTFRTLQRYNFDSPFLFATHTFTPSCVTLKKNKISLRAGLNRRPQPYQGCALPTELQRHCFLSSAQYSEGVFFCQALLCSAFLFLPSLMQSAFFIFKLYAPFK